MQPARSRRQLPTAPKKRRNPTRGHGAGQHYRLAVRHCGRGDICPRHCGADSSALVFAYILPYLCAGQRRDIFRSELCYFCAYIPLPDYGRGDPVQKKAAVLAGYQRLGADNLSADPCVHLRLSYLRAGGRYIKTAAARRCFCFLYL